MMFTLKTYVRFWMLISMALVYEYFAINAWPEMSVLRSIYGNRLTTEAGKSLSVWLGWIGITTMCASNVYSMRKRFSFMSNMGRLSRWLDFHIFCGLTGPTFILFHTNFKIGGLVAISFWSMVISFTSGVVGRYFYIQLSGTKTELERQADAILGQLKIFQAQSMGILTAEGFETIRLKSLALAGATEGAMTADVGAFSSLFRSLVGDFRLRQRIQALAPGLAPNVHDQLRSYAVTRRRTQYLGQFQQLMGYWHSFHLPFAFFMYLVAAIHIATALIMMVPE